MTEIIHIIGLSDEEYESLKKILKEIEILRRDNIILLSLVKLMGDTLNKIQGVR